MTMAGMKRRYRDKSARPSCIDRIERSAEKESPADAFAKGQILGGLIFFGAVALLFAWPFIVKFFG